MKRLQFSTFVVCSCLFWFVSYSVLELGRKTDLTMDRPSPEGLSFPALPRHQLHHRSLGYPKNWASSYSIEIHLLYSNIFRHVHGWTSFFEKMCVHSTYIYIYIISTCSLTNTQQAPANSKTKHVCRSFFQPSSTTTISPLGRGQPYLACSHDLSSGFCKATGLDSPGVADSFSAKQF